MSEKKSVGTDVRAAFARVQAEAERDDSEDHALARDARFPALRKLVVGFHWLAYASLVVGALRLLIDVGLVVGVTTVASANVGAGAVVVGGLGAIYALALDALITLVAFALLLAAAEGVSLLLEGAADLHRLARRKRPL